MAEKPFACPALFDLMNGAEGPQRWYEWLPSKRQYEPYEWAEDVFEGRRTAYLKPNIR